jgi:hypothetical protein
MPKLELRPDGLYKFTCPGCGNEHVIHTKELPNHNGAYWQFNGDVKKPTISPSINYRTGKYVDPNWTIDNEVCKSVICHSFVRDGRIQFLVDSTHWLRGMTVDLPIIDNAPVDGAFAD